MEQETKYTRKQHQAVLLELLEVFHAICEKHKIPYQLFAGTALGAVRHGGFIPWDDDLDIIMLRPDYERFLSVAPRELAGDAYYLQAEFSPHWPMFFSKLRKNGTTCLERYIPKDPQMHHGVYIDIFPCDNLSDRALVRRLQFAASKVVIAKGLHRRGYLTSSRGKKLFMALCSCIPLRPMHALVRLGGRNKTKMVHSFLAAAKRYEKNIYPRAWLENSVLADFAGGQYPLSKDADALLRLLYGDYMTLPPKEERERKLHAQLLDLEHSYEDYWEIHQNLKVDVYSESIR